MYLDENKLAQPLTMGSPMAGPSEDSPGAPTQAQGGSRLLFPEMAPHPRLSRLDCSMLGRPHG